MPENRTHQPPTARANRSDTSRLRCTLEPLRRHGAGSLACSDVDGIEKITLREIRFLWGGLGNEIEIRRSDDLYLSLRCSGRAFPTKPAITLATFVVKFPDSDVPRLISVRSNGRIELTSETDLPVLQRWLEARGFVDQEAGDDEATVATVGHR